jgi:hypothetical protein
VPPGTLTTGFEQGFILEVENTGRVCPVNSVLDEHDVMPSERRAYPCPKVNRAIRAKSSSGAAGLASGGTVV